MRLFKGIPRRRLLGKVKEAFTLYESILKEHFIHFLKVSFLYFPEESATKDPFPSHCPFLWTFIADSSGSD
jgi:hypothetical protein